MKRIAVAGISLAFFALATMLPGTAQAQSAYETNVGCGLGNQLFKEIGQDSILFQILAVTTNGTFGNQTFGITSGTLGCKTPSKVAFNEKINKFVADNMDVLAQDMASGRGEALDALAELLQVPADKKVEFYAALQANFTRIYTSENVQSADVLDNISGLPNS